MKKGNFCPLIKKDCIENKCSWYGQIRGVNPNTGQDVDEWNCVLNFLPFLLIENSQKQVQTNAAIESFRNESVNQSHYSTQMLMQVLSQATSANQIQAPDIRILDNPG